MKVLGKIGALAVASAMLASSAMAATLDITVMDVDNTGDDVMFTVTNNSASTLTMLTFDVRLNDDNAVFNVPANMADGNGIILGDKPNLTLSNFSFQNAVTHPLGDNREAYATLKWTLDDGLATGEAFTFNSWIQFLTDSEAPRQRGGIDTNADDIFVSAMFDDGATGSGFFDSLGATDRIGKGEIEIAPVPLPASSLLLLGGLAGLGAMRRRKKAA